MVFIDAAVEDYQYLATLVKPGIEAIAIDSQQDGIAQISQILAQRQGINAIHLVSHGQPGQVQLGGAKLNLENLPEYRQFLQQWKNYLSENATILIYGCQVAAADIGMAFVEAISNFTGINVIASNTLTGCAEKGGDWELQVATREPGKTSLAFQEEGLQKYAQVLANYTINPGDINGLIAAINQANTTSENDTISLAAGSTYALNSVNNTIVGDFGFTSGNGLPSIANQSIAGTLTLQGNGAIIKRNSQEKFRIFHVAAGGNLILDNLTVENGFPESLLTVEDWIIKGAAYGGGIYNEGNLTLTNSTITKNTVMGRGGGISNTGNLTISGSTFSDNQSQWIFGSGDGAGIYNDGGTVEIEDSLFFGNRAEVNGGAIRNNNIAGSVKVYNSTFDNNAAESKGGAIYNKNGSYVEINNSTLSNNIATYGGGLHNDISTATITNSTISGNKAKEYSGGIANSGSEAEPAKITIINSTITNNVADYNQSRVGNIGGIHNGGGTADIRNTIIAGNFNHPNESASASLGSDVSGNFIGNQNNLIGNIDGSTGFDPNGSDRTFASLGGITITNVLDLNLGLNGKPAGSPLTHALVPGSPAIDGGNNNFATIELNQISGKSVDIGAYESQINSENTSQDSSSSNNTDTQPVPSENSSTTSSENPLENTSSSELSNQLENTSTSDLSNQLENTSTSDLSSQLENTSTRDLSSQLENTSTSDLSNTITSTLNDTSDNNNSESSTSITQDSAASKFNSLLENPQVTHVQEQLGLTDQNIKDLASGNSADLPESLSSEKLDLGGLNLDNFLESENLNTESLLPLVSQVSELVTLPNNVKIEQLISGATTTSNDEKPLNNIQANNQNNQPTNSSQNANLTPKTVRLLSVPVKPASPENINAIPTTLLADESIDREINDTPKELDICQHFTELNFGELFINLGLINPAIANMPINEQLPNDHNLLMGTPDPDFINGWDGNDTILGYASADMILGGRGSAVPVGKEREKDLLFGNKGNDTLDGNEGCDRIYGGQDDDLIFGGKDDDLIYGDRGNDTLIGEMGSDRIYGASEDPSLIAEDGSDLLLGGSGDDFLNGNQKDDTLCGGEGDDTVRGGQGNDIVCGYTGNDWLLGDRGDDTVCGGDGEDTLYGGTEFNHTEDGEREGEDILFGGNGRDRFVLSEKGTVRILDFKIGEDLLLLTGGLTLADLSITAIDDATTAIRVAIPSGIATGNNQLIAILNSVNFGAIGVDNFSLI